MKNLFRTQFKKNKKYMIPALSLFGWYLLTFGLMFAFQAGVIPFPKSDSISMEKMEYIVVISLVILMMLGVAVIIVRYYFKNFGGHSASAKVNSTGNEPINIYGFRSIIRTNTKIKKSVIVLAHTILWLLLFSITLYSNSNWSGESLMLKSNAFTDSIAKLFLIALSFYPGYWIAPYLFSKKDGKGIILVLAIYAFSMPAAMAMAESMPNFSLETIVNIFMSFILFTLSIILGIGFRSLFGWVEQKRLQEILEKQNMKSELALLRTQLNPHFLFNTLHNIDALIKNNQNIASKSLIKLSDIMRYMLNDSKLEQVPVEKELMHIENYISLEKLRFKNNNFLNYSLTGKYGNIKIAPMLFIPFVENAFKHSVDSDLEIGISIHFYFENNVVKFICENLHDNSSVEKDKTHGIGLETVKRRLGLIYPAKHQLEIDETISTFKVQLEIIVDEN